MKVALAADHAGFALKQRVGDRLRELGHEVHDFGTGGEASCDYPDFAGKAARDVVDGSADCAILVCTTGIGMTIAANKIHGVRAALATNEDAVRLTREHNDANVLALAAKYTTPREAEGLVDAFLNTPFSGGERHVRRLEKIAALESLAQEEQTTRS
jgi:ribose 5-phosphate isomerase B